METENNMNGTPYNQSGDNKPTSGTNQGFTFTQTPYHGFEPRTGGEPRVPTLAQLCDRSPTCTKVMDLLSSFMSTVF